MNRRMFSPEVEELHREQRRHVQEVFTWAEKSSVDNLDRGRICNRARQINFSVDVSVPGDGFRFADELNALLHDIERIDPIGYAEMKRRAAKRRKKS